MLTIAPVSRVRFHISLNVNNLARSIDFYKILFDMEPAKQRSDYAKFEPNDPPLVLSLEPNGRADLQRAISMTLTVNNISFTNTELQK